MIKWTHRLSATVASAIAICCVSSALATGPGPASMIETLGTAGGVARITLSGDGAARLGLASGATMEFKIVADTSTLSLRVSDGALDAIDGAIQTSGRAQIRSGGGSVTIENLMFSVGPARILAVDAGDVHGDLFSADPRDIRINYSASDHTLNVTGSLFLSSRGTDALHLSADAATVPVGTIVIQSGLVARDIDQPAGPPGLGEGPEAGPDVIVGDITGPSNYAADATYDYYSWGTTSCNIGSAVLEWIDEGVYPGATHHSVVSQNLMRWKVVNGSGRFEQVGQAWLKHTFCALQQSLCASCTPYGSCCCDHLGVGCSDPYTSGRNGDIPGLGPKCQINPSTGAQATWPHPTPFGAATNRGRLRAAIVDIDPAQNAGARYFAECQYVTQDDAAAGNLNNNASYRGVTFGGASTYTAAYSGGTVRTSPAINAWGIDPDGAGPLTACESGVTYVNVDVPSDGRFILAYKVTNIGGPTPYHYEFALDNLNSNRGARLFSLPIPNGVNVANIGFHDTGYHDGDGNVLGTDYDGTDWTSSLSGGVLSWSCPDEATNANANALRWGNMWNFRFDADQPPIAGNATIGLYKSGSPSSMTPAVQVPQSVPCNPPVIDPLAATSTACGLNWNSVVPSASGTAPFTWSIVSAPLGMGINPATGQLNWANPQVSGSAYNITIQAASQCGPGTDTETLSLTVALGDFDGDGLVTLADVPGFVNDLLGYTPAQDCAGDMDGSTRVNGDDIDEFVAALIP